VKNIRSLTKEELVTLCEEMGEKKFRATQLWEWLWLKSARSFDQMTNLSKGFRAKLAAEFSFPVMTIANSQRSGDGTIKYAFRLDDGFLVYLFSGGVQPKLYFLCYWFHEERTKSESRRDV
jgi:23S rRNA (adenine2503-C2)-methyltransferase